MQDCIDWFGVAEIGPRFKIFYFCLWMAATDSAFLGAGATPGLELWRIENLSPVKLSKVIFLSVFIYLYI